MIDLAAIDPCWLCGRESDMNVTVEGRVEGLCSICWEKADVPAEGDDDDD